MSTTLTNQRASLHDGRMRDMADPYDDGCECHAFVKRRMRRAQRHAARHALHRWQPEPVEPRHKCKGPARESLRVKWVLAHAWHLHRQGQRR